MIPPAFTPETFVADVFERQPEAVSLFIARGTDCVGCMMAPFCTLREMSLHYAIGLDDFLGQLDEPVLTLAEAARVVAMRK